MADTKVPATTNLAVPQILNVEKPLPNEKIWEYHRRLAQCQINKGSRYPPFSIEHMPWERQRLAQPMTEEDRFLRKQWLADQNLSPDEPRYVQGAKPMSNARRMIRRPGDAIEAMMSKVINPGLSNLIRTMVPRFLIMYGLGVATYYYITFRPASWEGIDGVKIHFSRRSRSITDDTQYIPDDIDVFYRKGFDKRNSHIDGRTSAQGQ